MGKQKVIGIIDYGCGNVGSVQNMFSKIGVWSIAINHPSQIKDVNALVLPGVGAFDTGVLRLKETGFWEAIRIAVEKDKMPLLGICLGMQLFFEGSDEGHEKGFGWIPGQLEHFKKEDQIRIPHMSWEELQVAQENNVYFEKETDRFYFVHTFHAPTDLKQEYILAKCTYGKSFPAAVKNNNIVGFQFHPEKSLGSGMRLLSNWYKNTLEQ